MSHIIMLIPLNNNNIGLTTIGLSLVYLFNKYSDKTNLLKPILYISCQSNTCNDTTIIINKFFSNHVNVLKNIDFSNIMFNSHEYTSLLNIIMETCYEKKNLYKMIIVEGLSDKYNIDSFQINYDISQNISAKTILISHFSQFFLHSFQKKEEEIKYFLQKYQYKNFLGIIFNQIGSPFINKNIGFIKKLNILQQPVRTQKILNDIKIQIQKSAYPIIACIPWNQDLSYTLLTDIYHFLHAVLVNAADMKVRIIKKIIIFDNNDANILEQMNSNVLTILPLNHISIFIKTFYTKLKNNDIGSILLIGNISLVKNIIRLSKTFIQMNIPVIFMQNSVIEILYKLQNFYCYISVKDNNRIMQLQRYISSFLDINRFINFKKSHCSHISFSPKEFFYHLKMLSRKSQKYIILPEAYESRILKAVSICYNLDIAKCVLLGNPQKIYNIAKDQGIDLHQNIEIIDPNLIRKEYISYFMELRKHKGIDEFSAVQQLKDNTVLATLMLSLDRIDGVVSGSVNTTANTIRPALQLIKTNSISSLVSSIFFMLLPKKVLIYGDCAINIDPTAEELAEIAIQSSYSAKMFGIEPRIAMLSYSTGCSGIGKTVEKIKKATSIVRMRRPDLIIDGPIQYDAAVSKTVSCLKTLNSPLCGDATIFIFPDLNSGNITYKAVQRSAQLVSIGPMLQGLRKPVNDLSRGALVDDIIYTIALTSIQAI